MLPWLNKKSGGSIAATVEDGKVKDEGTGMPAMHAVAQDLISALESKDVAAVANALSAAMELNMPEGEI